jgi:hypothetical protein
MEMKFEKMITPVGVVTFAFLLVALIGCGKDPGAVLFPTTGTVTLDGQPVVGATVEFIPQGNSENGPLRGAIGATDEEGKYLMVYRQSRGCEAGDYTVSIKKSSYREPTGDETEDEMQALENDNSVSLPAVYGGTKSKLEATVSSEGENIFNFALKSDGS